MSLELALHPEALREWHKLDATVRDQFKKKLAERHSKPTSRSRASRSSPPPVVLARPCPTQSSPPPAQSPLASPHRHSPRSTAHRSPCHTMPTPAPPTAPPATRCRSSVPAGSPATDEEPDSPSVSTCSARVLGTSCSRCFDGRVLRMVSVSLLSPP